MIRGRWGTAAAVLGLMMAIGCGRRGPPLEPFVRIPDGVLEIAARRAGNDVYVTLTIPAQNIDGSLPIAIDRVEVYGYTGVTPPPQARWVEFGTRVATVPVVVPAPDALAAQLAPSGLPTDAAAPEEVVVVRDRLSPDQLVHGPVLQTEPGRSASPVGAPPTAPTVLQRFYTAFAFDPRGRPGPPGGVAQFEVDDLPSAPSVVSASYSEATIDLEWTPSGGVVGYLLERPLPSEARPRGVPPSAAVSAQASVPSGATTYNVYPSVAAGIPLESSGAVVEPLWRVAPVSPLNGTPLAEPSYSEPVRFGTERCYVVRAARAARAAGVDAVESAPSPPLCLIPEDVFPPGAPRGLAAVSTEGRVSLIWVPNDEADIAGYMVLRGEVGETTLRPITETPVREARFLDDNVLAGVRYQYAVVALDTRPVPNRSAESARVEATAR